MAPYYGLGVDVGSTTTKAVLIDSEKKTLASHLMLTGAAASETAQSCIDTVLTKAQVLPDEVEIVSTGYGRTQVSGSVRRVTEITCHSVGIHHLNPEIALLIDVGGQDSKVIRIGTNGRPQDFEINDKCSAGTGRFLEVMARVLKVSLQELSSLALRSTAPCTISSTCTVFAESEVIGRIGSGDDPKDIAAGIHQSMAAKISTLAKRVGLVEPVGLTGGVSLNEAFRFYLSKQLATEIWVPNEPQLTGALGAAILAIASQL